MSTKALFWALEQRIPMGPKTALIHLADWYNTHESAAWPTHDMLADKMGCSRRSAQRHIEWLVEHGLATKEKQIRSGRQVQNRYRLPVGVMVFQGGQYDAADCDNLTQPGGQSDAPSNTIKDTVKDTIIGGEPQETNLKIQEVIDGKSKSKEEILTKFTPTPKGCGDLWRDCRAAAGDHGFQAELTNAHWKMLNQARIRLGDVDFPELVWRVMHNWDSFCKHAESHAGAFNSPLVPQVAYFVKFIEAAADYAAPVKSIAKPLTNKHASSKPIPKAKKEKAPAITLPELLAMNEDTE